MNWLKYAAIAVVALPGIAEAHGPSRQKVELEVVVDATAEEAWAYIGDFYDMSWHPVVYATEAGTLLSTVDGDGTAVTVLDGEPDYIIDDSTRILTLAEEGGPTITEVLYKLNEERMTYSYRIVDVSLDVLPVTNYSSHLTVKEADDGTVSIEWRGAFYRGDPNGDPAENLNDEAAITAVTGVYQAGLDALVEHFAND